ncbi:LacI family DNA-binding transcriptional regulator [Pseudoalteromonas sp. SR44-5]|uniref:LacI family DNA-binding transcriptional regulator n=1 Tax=Pseudoalteromonas TaxID=53246 RepID=UPI001601C4A1|nr:MULTISPECIES: LacI family DNA-binding transcriptional regulator [unclassified Pseudoalteromonas]MBB1333654.1 LacI family DNA-binding transcriptional regulator [Pseudoalteromonas sp. SR41-6]MBB1341566.1 LacI family DNA-binding transcriptional regulator [Pseudoalteromonas sp. SR45-6]MBB1366885.1 LacI family DNA-binding transcriptional regulator [Pseudoalteromonas sp. SR44-5]MBB1417913.1 LacI family DNA-binding transcriptional regulator [Pseudoalteromonas sp. SG44-1]MBB1422575.1 LacI family DN
MATIYEVSKLAGVSLATVSRVMNNNTNVSDATRKKVTVAMTQLGYRPNSIAQSLASNCSNSVGLLVSELHGPFYGPMMSDIENAFRNQGKHVIITAGHSDADREQQGIEFLISRNCDGLILHVEAISDDYLIELSKGSTPFVLINRLIPELADRCIVLNNIKGGYLATKYVLEQGHRDIAYISGPLWKKDAQDRLTGHKQALAEFDLEFNEQLLYQGDFMETSGSAGFKLFHESNHAFTALICANDEMAIGAMATAREYSIKLPEQLSIMGYDNVFFTRHIYPPLTTINYPINDIGKMAAKWILSKVYGKGELPLQTLFEPELIVRQSIITNPQ